MTTGPVTLGTAHLPCSSMSTREMRTSTFDAMPYHSQRRLECKDALSAPGTVHTVHVNRLGTRRGALRASDKHVGTAIGGHDEPVGPSPHTQGNATEGPALTRAACLGDARAVDQLYPLDGAAESCCDPSAPLCRTTHRSPA